MTIPPQVLISQQRSNMDNYSQWLTPGIQLPVAKTLMGPEPTRGKANIKFQH